MADSLKTQKVLWYSQFDDWVKAKKKTKNLSLSLWCQQRQIPYGPAAQKFKAMSQLLTGEVLALTAPRAAERLAQLIEDPDPELALRASTSTLDRSGFSPQQVAIQINNNVTQQVAIAPLFSADYSKKVNAFLGEPDEPVSA